MSVLFCRYDVEDLAPPEDVARLYLKKELADRTYGLHYEPIHSDQRRADPIVLDPTPGTAVCIQTEISERRDFPDNNTACYYLHVEVGFIFSHGEGPVKHHVTVMQNAATPPSSAYRTFVYCDQGGVAARALKARLEEIEQKLRGIDFNGQSLLQIVEAVRRDVWVYHNPPGGKEDAPYSVRVTYLN